MQFVCAHYILYISTVSADVRHAAIQLSGPAAVAISADGASESKARAMPSAERGANKFFCSSSRRLYFFIRRRTRSRQRPLVGETRWLDRRVKQTARARGTRVQLVVAPLVYYLFGANEIVRSHTVCVCGCVDGCVGSILTPSSAADHAASSCSRAPSGERKGK